ncbi:MAG TPA: polysaccharide biosynthesis tyrosine autokinase [Chitinophaga sp.]|uniref:GumC family protein n=1 Tax=Chitinophaga sp. TaxID=1869181 RepID=UPI002DBFBDA1|nr:polysaccharide biosynthesis tyrosine autokinase [Chitinophaga sp.]HEU4554224.1 polysaccharide biosynthesis tyrosine autokinase [Chitinophaga sp.]
MQHPNRRPQQEEQVDLMALIRQRYLPYWPLFLLSVIIALTIAFVYLRYATPVYYVSATLLVKDEKTGMDEADILQSLNIGGGSKKVIDNEIEIIKSRTLAKDVIRNLNLFAEVSVNGKIRDVVAYDDSPVRFKFLDPDSIKPTAYTVLPLVFDARHQQVKIGSQTYPLYDTVHTRWGKVVITPRPGKPVNVAGKTYVVRIAGEKILAGLLQSNLKVEPTTKSGTIISLGYTDVAPKRGEDILNELVRVYNDASIEDKNRTSANTMAFVDDRLRVVNQELSEVESNVASFKKQQGIVDISEQSKLFLESVSENDRKIAESSMQLSMLDSIEHYVRGRKEGESTVPATLGVSDPVLLELVSKLSEVELQLDRLSKTTGENSPLLQSLRKQEAQLKPSILQNIRSLRSNTLAAQARLQAENNRYNSMLRGVPEKEKAFVEVSRQQEIKNNIYTFLLQKREETAVASAAAVSDSRIVDAAEALGTPISPKKTLVLAIAVVAGLAFIAGLITIRDMMKREITSRAEIEKATQAPILAEILQDVSKQPLVIAEGRRSYVAEQFRSLRTALSYIGLSNLNGNGAVNGNGTNGSTHHRKTLLVTSSISGEGKSFISVNLATSLSLVKKKVALLEFDLRKPQISKMLGVSREPGISNYLVGQAEIASIIQPVPGNEYLYILPAGAIPPNPTELILNGQLEKLIANLKTRFDYVIIDTAPVGLVTDARLLAAYADATLYVIRHQVTPKLYLRVINELYQNKELGNLNLVFNGIQPRGINGYGPNGYGYGYGYIEDAKGTRRKQFLKGIFNI